MVEPAKPKRPEAKERTVGIYSRFVGVEVGRMALA